jgi:phage/plasmid-associated DNA primase
MDANDCEVPRSRRFHEHMVDAFTSSATLFASWKEWASVSGEAVGTKKSFVQSLESRGFE